MKGAATSFRRTSFVVQTKILYCETTITNKIPFWRQQLSQFVRKFVFQNKAKNAGRSGKNAGMREIGLRKNAGFPARLRDEQEHDDDGTGGSRGGLRGLQPPPLI